MRPARWRGAAAALAAGLLLGAASGCGGDDRWARPTASDTTQPHAVDVASVPGLETVARSEEDARHRLYTAYPAVPGARPLTERLAEAVDELAAPYRRAAASALAAAPGTSAAPGASVPELNVQWTLTAASGDIVGVRLTGWSSQGADAGESRRTYWYDGRTGQAVGSDGLVDGPSGLKRLADLVRARIVAKADPARVTPTPETFASMAFNDDGDLVVEFSDHSVAPAAPGRVAVALPASAFEPLLSDFGRRARAASLTPRPRLALGADAPGPGGPEGARTPADAPNCAVAKCVALTFDDGPGPDTPRLLDELNRAGVRVTFFVVGTNAAAYPELVRREAAEGHEIGDHSQDHRDLTRLPPIQVHAQIQETQDVLRQITGQAPVLLRPPYGASNGVVSDVARSLGLVQALWNADTLDWRDRDASAVADRAVAGARPGGVVLMHDIYGTTVDAVPQIIARLKAQGYTPATVSDLLAARHVRPGERFSGG
ncbi:polysaccharide deacetylase family protein [Actinomadura rupiterrae]|uniref:polysaccharide deacetylase family protein n=1 Tax=Actinomadura rupiterrae TaxID=559627 RepID=UPI0020A46412|nr:polysaccharide deacetylase family protein [Actinomadura rupiterrae]MCP2339457.1 peptidoglycan/xylan/chitin deacetylase (PgdA/CDA1 family) [Actinomadura rupiterrae]